MSLTEYLKPLLESRILLRIYAVRQISTMLTLMQSGKVNVIDIIEIQQLLQFHFNKHIDLCLWYTITHLGMYNNIQLAPDSRVTLS